MIDGAEPTTASAGHAPCAVQTPLFVEDVPCEVFALQLAACRQQVLLQCSSQPAPYPAFTLFFSVADATHRARVVHATADDLATAWSRGVTKLHRWMSHAQLEAPVLRVDWVEGTRAVSWECFNAQLDLTRRHHFRLGLALDRDFVCAFTEQELNAHGMLDDGPDLGHAAVHAGHFRRYARARFGDAGAAMLPPIGPVVLLTMRGVFCAADGAVHLLAASGPDAGRREFTLDADTLLALVEHGTDHLARKVQPDGMFRENELPGFGERETPAERHPVGPLSEMIDAWTLTRDANLREAIERVVQHLTETLVRPRRLAHGLVVAFPIDRNDEISLGSCAECLLGLLRYSEATGSQRWLTLLEQMGAGIVWLQESTTGRFNHVVHASNLALKAASQIVPRDGEAVYALLRLYAFSGDSRWLHSAENAFEHFCETDRWTTHEAWLSACVNELTRWRPKEKYFQFGLQNTFDLLDIVLECKTTAPALLELMLAGQKLLERLDREPALRHLMQDLDRAKVDRALAHRAHCQLNSFFWPEIAMYFEQPARVEGAFFSRQRGFQVDIGDIGQGLSGLLGYRRWLVGAGAVKSATQEPDSPVALEADASGFHPLPRRSNTATALDTLWNLFSEASVPAQQQAGGPMTLLLMATVLVSVCACLGMLLSDLFPSSVPMAPTNANRYVMASGQRDARSSPGPMQGPMPVSASRCETVGTLTLCDLPPSIR